MINFIHYHHHYERAMHFFFFLRNSVRPPKGTQKRKVTVFWNKTALLSNKVLQTFFVRKPSAAIL